MNEIDRTPGILAALDYLGLDFGHLPVVGRTLHAIPKRKPRRAVAAWIALKMRFC